VQWEYEAGLVLRSGSARLRLGTVLAAQANREAAAAHLSEAAEANHAAAGRQAARAREMGNR